MAEVLITLAQYLSLGGYLYGALLVTTHLATGDQRRATDRRRQAERLDNEDAAVWQRYLACDF
jgi:hypothetical protein